MKSRYEGDKMKTNKITKLSAIMAIPIIATTACGTDGGDASEGVNFPSDDITIIVPFGAGGANDVLARTLAEHIEAADDQWNFVIQNVEGGGGAVGQAEGAEADPDGHTLTMVTNSIVANPMFNEVPYTHESFQAVGVVNQEPKVLLTGSDSGIETFEEFVEAAEENPGNVSVGTSGAETIDSFHNAELERQTDTELVAVPHDGTAEAVVQAEGGHIDAVWGDYAEVRGHLEADSLNPILVLADERMEELAETPVYAEVGLEDANFPSNWRGVAVPEGTDEAIVDVLDEVLRETSESEAYVDAVEDLGLNAYYGGPEELNDLIEQTAATYSEGR